MRCFIYIESPDFALAKEEDKQKDKDKVKHERNRNKKDKYMGNTKEKSRKCGDKTKYKHNSADKYKALASILLCFYLVLSRAKRPETRDKTETQTWFEDPEHFTKQLILHS